MQNTNDLPTIEKKIARVGGISRREAARRLLTAIAAGATLPWETTAHPIWKHFEDEHLMNRAEAAVLERKLHFLNAQQFEWLSALSEAIVPGSTEANVANFIDLLLSEEGEKHQKEFVSSLAAIETESNKKYGKSFSGISTAQKNELLTAVSARSKTEQTETTLSAAFENLKEWISGAYYSSELGMRELGWTPDRVFAEFPGCTHVEGHESFTDPQRRVR
jgi:glucoside 3-dehydrogenase (cytochrome c) hitch-hiker subunit